MNFIAVNVGDVLKTGQKWFNYEDNVRLTILKINPKNSTFAGTYSIVRELEDVFQFRGAFDPEGITLGWSLAYWNERENDHAFGAWSGYMDKTDNTYKMTLTGIISHQSDRSTSNGQAIFVLEDD